MEKQLIEETKKYIKESSLSEEAKIQLLSLMDFVNYPEVKEKVLQILDAEEKLTDLEIKYLKEMNKRFRNTDLFGYNKQGIQVSQTMKQNMTTNNEANAQKATPSPSTVTANNQVQPQTTNTNPNSGPIQTPNVNMQQAAV
jgi:hypothetical protein